MFEQAFKKIGDALWKDAGCTSELDYTEQSSWLLFLKYLVAKPDAITTQTQRMECHYTQMWAALAALKKSLLHQAFTGAF